MIASTEGWSAGYRKLRHAGLLAFCLLAAGKPGVAAEAPDTAEFLQAALAVLGGVALSGIVISGAGWDACPGQAWSIAQGWARWELTEYRRVIDYVAGSSRHNTLRRAGMDPGRIGGCGAQPEATATPQQGFIDGSSAWSEQLLIWMTPHGFLRLMEAGQPTITNAPSGWQVNLPLARDGIGYTFEANFNPAYQLLTLSTWIDDAIFGDMEVRAEYGPYRAFDGLSYPASLTLKQGGFATLQLAITGVAPSTEVIENPAPRRPAGGGGAATEGPAWSRIGEGIFAIHGSYQAVAVEFADFSVVIDGLQNDARVQSVIRSVREAIPDKPIRYVVTTHSHFDHAYGLRQFAAEGAIILTHAMNADFFRQALAQPRTLRSTQTEPSLVPVQVQGVDGRFVISDEAGQVVELHALAPGPHAADMLVAYLPSIKAVVEADILQPWINPVFGGGREGPHPFLVYLAQELERAGIDYERFVPIHVPPSPPLMPRADLDAVLGTPAAAAP